MARLYQRHTTSQAEVISKMWMIALFICIFVAEISSQQFNGTKFQNLSELPVKASSMEPVQCGNAQKMIDECFKDMKPPLTEFLHKSKIALNAEEIDAKCNIFNSGMKCFDDYSARCLSNYKQELFQNNVEGARKFFAKFCNDAQYQKDYLRHKECLSYIQDDWVRCTKDFQKILTDELHGTQRNSTGKFMEFCCARHAYENCIYNSARFKCYKHSAKFARETAQIFADEKHFSSCKPYEGALCGVGHSTRSICSWHYLRLALMPLLLLALRKMQTP